MRRQLLDLCGVRFKEWTSYPHASQEEGDQCPVCTTVYGICAIVCLRILLFETLTQVCYVRIVAKMGRVVVFKACD